jgi:hypothetical protein
MDEIAGLGSARRRPVDFQLWKVGELMVGFDAETIMMKPATTLREAFQATNPQQSLGSGDPYYVDLTKARNSHATAYMKQTIENCGEGQYSPIVLSGHRGSGKSTELRQLEQALGSSCFMLYLDVADFLDPQDIDYTDLFLLVCRQILESLHEQKGTIRGPLAWAWNEDLCMLAM